MDPTVSEAIQLLEGSKESAVALIDGAIAALKRNNRYNGKGITYHDYTGTLRANAERLLEPFIRLIISKDNDQARDVIGYAALFSVAVLRDLPPSLFDEVIVTFERRYYEAMKLRDTGKAKTIT